MHTAVRRAVGILLETCLAHRTVESDEGWHAVVGPERGRKGDLWIDSGRAAAGRWLCMAPGAAVEIEARAETVSDAFFLGEIVPAIVEENEFACRQAGKGASSPGGTAANTRIARS